MSVVTGEYVLLLDADDILLPWALETVARAALDHGGPTLIMSRWQPFQREEELPTECVGTRARAWPDFLSSVHEHVPVTTATAVRRDTLRRFGGFHEAHFGSEDLDLWLRLGTSPGFVYLDGTPIYGYRQHASSTTHQAERLAPGVHFLCSRERHGAYPGEKERADDRRHLIGRNVLYAANRCMKLGAYRRAYGLLVDGMGFMVGHGLGREEASLAMSPIRRRLRHDPAATLVRRMKRRVSAHSGTERRPRSDRSVSGPPDGVDGRP